MDVVRAKRTYGIWYGAALGFLFALFPRDLDACSFSQMNALHSWLKFATGGLTGWLPDARGLNN